MKIFSFFQIAMVGFCCVPSTWSISQEDNLSRDITGKSRNTRSLRMNRSWTKSGYGILFVYSNYFTEDELRNIRAAVSEIKKYSCFPATLLSESQFRNAGSTTRYPHYVFIEKNHAVGCGQAFVGMHGGYQLLTLNPDPRCLTFGTIIHEMLHTLGIEHEQSRPDRNQYIFIHDSNVQNGLQNVFGIAYGSTPYGPFDFDSVMLYGRNAFSYYPGLPTLSSKVPGHAVPFIAHTHLSQWDKRKINIITGCKVNS